MELVNFVDKCSYFTHRLCRRLSIQVVLRHLNLRRETTKNIDKANLHQTLPALEPEKFSDLKYIGVDEVVRAKGHDYMTVAYDMCKGHLIWVETGQTANFFQLSHRSMFYAGA